MELQIVCFLVALSVVCVAESAVTKVKLAPVKSTVTTKECSVILSPNIKSYPRLSGHILCIRRSKQELKKQLKEAGGYNLRYVAITKTQAMNFENLISVNAFASAKVLDEISENVLDESQTKGKDIEASSDVPVRGSESTRSQTQVRDKREVPKAPGTVLRACVVGGSLVSGSVGVVHMCTECTATTRLEADKFPTFINEVVCHSQSYACAKNVGICKQKGVFQTILRRTGQFEIDVELSQQFGQTVYREIWAEHTQEIRSCCECQVFLSKYQTF